MPDFDRKFPLSRPNPEALAAAAREVLRACFIEAYGEWCFKTHNGIPMGMSPRKRTAVRKLAAFESVKGGSK